MWTKSLAAAVAVAVMVVGFVFREPLRDWVLGRGPAAALPAGHYTCSMDPSVRAREPGQCPICGMALTPVTEAQRGTDLVHVDGAAMQRIGVRLAAAAEKTLRTRTSAAGAVTEAAASPGAAARVDAQVDPGAIDTDELNVGRQVALELPVLPLTRFVGTIEQVAVDSASGAASLRIAVQDPGQALRPGMHAEIEIATDLPRRLVVPASAVIVAGKRRLVLVDRGKGLFEPRQVDTGVQAGGLLEVRKGLEAGERVVISGTFLLAAENRIRSSGALWTEEEEKKRPDRKADQAKQEAKP